MKKVTEDIALFPQALDLGTAPMGRSLGSQQAKIRVQTTPESRDPSNRVSVCDLCTRGWHNKEWPLEGSSCDPSPPHLSAMWALVPKRARSRDEELIYGTDFLIIDPRLQGDRRVNARAVFRLLAKSWKARSPSSVSKRS